MNYLTVRLKLTGDPGFQPLSDFTNDGAAAAPTLWDGSELQEGFFKYADLTGKDLVIAQQSKGEPKKAYVVVPPKWLKGLNFVM